MSDLSHLSQEAAEQAVLVMLRLSDDRLRREEERQVIITLGEELAEAIAAAGVGEFDGDEFGQGTCSLYMYGPSADNLFDVLKPFLTSFPIGRGSYVVKRYGPPGAPEARIDL